MTEKSSMLESRRLAASLEAVAGQVYFSPECHAGYQALGFAGSPGQLSGVAMPDGAAYFCSRGSLLGQVPGELVAAAFGVFNPAVVTPAVTYGWGLTSAPVVEAARTEGALAQLERILGSKPDGVDRLAAALEPVSAGLPVSGHPLYAGLLAVEVPKSQLGATWRFADRLREFRGDAHIAAWTSSGLDAVEIGLLTELYWGLPSKSYIRTRAWSEEELDAGLRQLEQRGLTTDGALTDQGREVREDVERATDRQCQPIVDTLGSAFEDVVAILDEWSAAIRSAGGYPASGPHDLARAAT
jgi:hypothetical protein